MADYSTLSAFSIEVTDTEREWFLKLITALERGISTEWGWEMNDSSALSDAVIFREMMGWSGDLPEDWGWEISVAAPSLIQFCMDDGGSIELMAQVLQSYFNKFQHLDSYTTFEWANVCSKMRSNAFSGGGMVVTAHGYEQHNICDWIYDRTVSLDNKMLLTPKDKLRKFIKITREQANHLDELVFEAKSAEASMINNVNEDAQLAYLLSHAFSITMAEAESFIASDLEEEI